MPTCRRTEYAHPARIGMYTYTSLRTYHDGGRARVRVLPFHRLAARTLLRGPLFQHDTGHKGLMPGVMLPLET